MPLFSLGERDHKESNATVGGAYLPSGGLEY